MTLQNLTVRLNWWIYKGKEEKAICVYKLPFMKGKKFMHIEITIPEERIDGNKITLNVCEIINIKRTYEVESIKEYVEENHSDWTMEKVNAVSTRAWELFDDVERGDEEAFAINQAELEWNNMHKD